ncbi:MAG: DUF364 domain-containing protein [Candidatus Cloacimonadota bacterium]|nr:DUF364 domain-containing protein [Candidatus Cloacimonadota bacterium]
MQILEKIVDSLPNSQVKDVFVGVFDVAVESNKLGIATTVKEESLPHEGINNSIPLNEHEVGELALYAFSENWLEASLGMAAINSALSKYEKQARHINAKKLIEKYGIGKKVGIIGHFPFVENSQNKFSELMVFEKEPQKGDFSEKMIPEKLPHAEVVAITSTSFTNHTLEFILNYVASTSYVILLGPTTPLTPVLFNYHIDALCGVYFDEPLKIKRQIREATPYRKIKGKRYITLLKEDF